MKRRRSTFINALPYVIFMLTIAIVIFVGYTMFEDYKKSMNPGDQSSEGISMSLGTTSGNAYVGDDRIEVSILGQNYGALTCSSTNEKVASCGVNGTTLVVKPGNTAGEAVIVVKEASGNNTVAYEIKVLGKTTAGKEEDKEEDKNPTTGNNTGSTTTSSLSLSYSYGTIYVGNTATLYIKGSNYGELSCSSSNTTVATCSISGTKLLISPKTTGSATITVKGTSGKSATYKATVAKKSSTTTNTSTSNTNFYLTETKGVTSVGGSTLVTTVKGSNYGEVSCSSSNRSVAICGVNGTEIKITPQSKAGTVTLTVKESKNSKTSTYTVTVLPKGVTEVPTLTLSSTTGTTKGAVLTATISGSNYGKLTCSSSSTAIATCNVVNNTLSITPRKDGEATITVKEATAGVTATYKVIVKYEYECLEGTLTKDSVHGTICVTPGYEEEVGVCSKYATPTASDSYPSDSDDSFVSEDAKIQCNLNPSSQDYWDRYTCFIISCAEYEYKTEYTCPRGWLEYSGNNSTLKCYKSASVKN